MVASENTPDWRDPRALLEAEEQQDALRLALAWCLEAAAVAEVGHRAVQVLRKAAQAGEECDMMLRRVLAWCCEPDKFARVGERVMIAAGKLQIAEGARFTQAQIAAQTGCGRSHANKLAMDFSRVFGVRGPHDRSNQARAAYQAAWRKTHGAGDGARRARRERNGSEGSRSEARCGSIEQFAGEACKRIVGVTLAAA